MQENNNFETIISSWRRMSAGAGEQLESVTVSMSGDSDFHSHKKKDEEASLLVPEKLKGPIATVASAGTVAAIAEVPKDSVAELEEKLLNHKEETKEAAGDATNKSENEYLENNVDKQTTDVKQAKSSDKVDSVYVSPPAGVKPPPQSTSSKAEDEDCMINCLYYTLQCCDCVLM